MTADYEPIGVHFSLRCVTCDAGDGICCREQAEAFGWCDVEYDDGLSWNFLGCCPECIPAMYGEEPQP